MYEPKSTLRPVVRMLAVFVVCGLLGVAVAGMIDGACRPDPPAAYELRISDEDGFQLIVPKD